MSFRRWPVVLMAALLAGCASSRPSPSDNGTSAVARVLQQDDVLGTQRNHACETAPLAQAVRDYVRGLAALDFSGCPDDFVDAFTRHREAWEASIPFFEAYHDLRGEMHDLFEQIRDRDPSTKAELEELEAGIWGTWAEVEAAIERTSAAPPS
jgi:hypothetical protein